MITQFKNNVKAATANKIKYLKVGIVLLGCFISLFFFSKNLCSAAYDQDSDDYITIAYVGGLTGELSQASRKSLNALKLAVDGANLQGGAHGKMFRVVSFDNKHSPVNNIHIFDEIINTKAIAITGIHVSDDGLILADLAEKHHIPMVVASATHPDITKKRKYVVRACFNDNIQGQYLADFAFNKLRKRNAVVVVNADDSFSIYLAIRFSEIFNRLGGQISQVFNIRTGTTEYRHLMKHLEDNKLVDLLFLTTSAIESGFIIGEMSSLGIDKTILGSDGWQSNHLDTLLLNMKKNNIKAYYSAHWYKGVKREESIKFIQKYKEIYGDEISSFDADAILTYDAASILIDSIKKTKNVNGDEIIKNIKNNYFKGATGNIKISENGEATKTIYMMKIENGLVEPYMEWK